MDDIKSKVKAWIANGCDFDEGLALLSKYSTHRALIKNLHRGEPNQDKLEHLSYHLSELAGITEVMNPDVTDFKPTNDPFITTVSAKDYPAHIVEMKKEKQAMIKERSVKHKEYATAGTNNDPASIAARKSIHEAIDALTDKINAKDDEIRLAFDALNTTSAAPVVVLPVTGEGDGAKSLVGEALKKNRELDNLVSSLSKDRSKVKQAKGNTLKKITERIATKAARIAVLREELGNV